MKTPEKLLNQIEHMEQDGNLLQRALAKAIWLILLAIIFIVAIVLGLQPGPT